MKRKDWIIVVVIAIALVIAAYLALMFTWRSYYNRGTDHMNNREYDRAILCFNKAIKINWRFAEAYCNRGIAYCEKGECDRAILDFDKAIEIRPEFAEAYGSRAIAYYDKQEYDEASADVRKAQSLGHRVPPDFLDALGEASGPEK
ncbi:MAG: tetratricopeptide repeat protein [Phycisphaerales bacterium]|jgi:tetratricopeptide (TPR) repeat protein